MPSPNCSLHRTNQGPISEKRSRICSASSLFFFSSVFDIQKRRLGLEGICEQSHMLKDSVILEAHCDYYFVWTVVPESRGQGFLSLPANGQPSGSNPRCCIVACSCAGCLSSTDQGPGGQCTRLRRPPQRVALLPAWLHSK